MNVPLLLRKSLRRANLHLPVRAFSVNRLISQRSWSTLTKGPSSLTVDALKATFPYVWLRDSCQSPECIHPTTAHKLHKSSDIPLDVKPIEGGVHLLDEGIAIEWTDGHKSHFPISFLERHSSPEKLAAFHKEVVSDPWDNETITRSRDLFIPYRSLQTPVGMLGALKQISRYGLLFVKDVPHTETSDETCELPILAEMFGYIRTTFFGRLWDVQNVHNSKNVAYTNLDLGFHMDLQYLEEPPRYQILHCLRNRVEGGQSLFVDGVQCAALLQETHPSYFDILANTPVAFHYIHDGHHLQYEHPTIQLANPASGNPPGTISQINYSPPFQAPLPLSTPDAFYPAFKYFSETLNDPSNTYRHTLQEGDAVIFDNRRILHSRTAFHDIERQEMEGETNRWLKGCYLEADDLLDRRRVLEAKLS